MDLELLQDPAFMYQELIDSLDPEAPGFGESTFNELYRDRPMAYGLILSAEANRFKHTGSEQAWQLVQSCGNWLLEHNDLDNDGIPGYGLADVWDAFEDGSPNPLHHEYTITTAVCIDALLDWYAVEKDPEVVLTIEEVIEATLAVYMTPDHDSPLGIPGYSLNPSDQQYDVFNPAMYLTRAMYRYAELEPINASEYISRADDIIEICLEHRQVNDDGTLFFTYSAQNDTPNDLVHELYCLEGLRAYEANSNSQFDLTPHSNYTDLFFVEGVWYESLKEANQNPENVRLWALGMLAYSLSTGEAYLEVEETLIPQISNHYMGGGRFKFKENDNRNLIRHNAHLVFGLSHFLFHD